MSGTENHKFKLGYLGPKYSFSEQAAKKAIQLLGDEWELYEYTKGGNYAVMDGLKTGEVDSIVMAIRNTVTGVLEHHIERLDEMGAKSFGMEVDILVKHCAMGFAPKLETQKYIYVHPVARRQCNRWFREHNWLIEKDSDSNSQAALDAVNSNPEEYCCIAPEVCAEVHGMTLYAVAMQDVEDNTTTFDIFKIPKENNNG